MVNVLRMVVDSGIRMISVRYSSEKFSVSLKLGSILVGLCCLDKENVENRFISVLIKMVVG